MVSAQHSEGRSAAEWALHQILGLIRARSLGPGDRLPAERDLGTRLGVSRGSVREATSALVTMGVLEARHGAGVFVTGLQPATVLPSLTHVLGIVAMNHPAAIARLHAQVEGAAAARAAARSTPESLAPLVQALAELRLAAHEPAPRGHHDQFKATISQLSDDRFHRAVATIADDPVAEGMILLLRGCRDPQAVAGRDLHTHAALVQAIADHEPDEARSLAERLLSIEHVATAVLDDPAGVRPTPSNGRSAGNAGAGRGTATSTSTDVRAERDDPPWFRDAKFGLIVHWGPYTVPGWAPLPRGTRSADPAQPPRADSAAGSGGTDGPPNQYFAEWYQAAAAQHGSATAEYHQRVHGGRPYRQFQPAFEAAVGRWSPDQWTEDFAASGARYVVMVAKHHDGYLLWPSRVRHSQDERWRSERDVVGEVATAVRAAGLRFGIFYSSGDDWSYTARPAGQASDVQTSRPLGGDYARYVEAHWRELMERYEPDGLWNDTGYPAAGDAHRLIAEYRARVPDGVVTGRFRTSTAGVPAPAGAPWESVRPIGLSFGWNRQETAGHALSGAELVLTLMDVVANNGNLLLGVSPDDTGALPPHQRAGLRFLGRWLARFGQAVYGTSPWQRPTARTTQGRSVWFTCSGGDVFVTIEGDGGGPVELDGVRLDPRHEALCLEPATVVPLGEGARGTVLSLPPAPADSPVTVLRLARAAGGEG